MVGFEFSANENDESGATWQWSDDKVYRLTNHDAELRAHAGHVVDLTGELKGDTIRISTIEMPPASK